MSYDTYAGLGLDHGKIISFFSIYFAIAVLFFLSGLSLGEMVEYCYDTPLNDLPGWSQNITAQMFDPSLGGLKGAQITINLTVLHDVQAYNQGNASANIILNSSRSLSLSLPDKSVFNVESVIDLTELMAPKKELNLNKSISKIQNLSLDESQLKRFTASHPNETIVLPLVVASNISCMSDGPLTSNVALKSKASICITYDYYSSKNQNESVINI